MIGEKHNKEIDKIIEAPQMKTSQLISNRNTFKNMTKNLILGGRSLEIWSYIDDDLATDIQKKEKINELRKTTNKRYTLIFDIIDLFIEIIDPSL